MSVLAKFKDEIKCSSLSDVQFNACAQMLPWIALTREHICSRMSDEQFDYCALHYPGYALTKHCNRLSDKRFDDFIKRVDYSPALSPDVKIRANPYQRAWRESLAWHRPYLVYHK